MDSVASAASDNITHDFRPIFLVHEDGHVECLLGGPYVSPLDDPFVAVRSRDVIISPDVSARLYLPATVYTSHKLPILVYVHGGAFCIGPAFSAIYHQYLNSLVAAAKVVAAPLIIDWHRSTLFQHATTMLGLPFNGYVTQHSSGQGPDPWLNEFGDLSRMYIAGDSAGANIAHDLMIRSGLNGLRSGCILSRVILIHPFFGDGKSNKFWEFMCNETVQVDDPRLNPAFNPAFPAQMVCGRVLICIEERDELREIGWNYYEALEKSDWDGIVEIQETQGEEHVFHLKKLECNNSRILMSRIVSFINEA